MLLRKVRKGFVLFFSLLLVGTAFAGNLSIIEQPVSIWLIYPGMDAEFRVSVTGVPTPLSYQWQRRTSDGTWVNIPGAKEDIFRIEHVQWTENEEAPYFRVIISNGVETITSEEAFLSVFPPVFLHRQPASQRLKPGEPLKLEVSTVQSFPCAFQWQKRLPSGNWVDIKGSRARKSSLYISGIRKADSGEYRVVVTSPYGSVVSEVATVTVRSRNGKQQG